MTKSRLIIISTVISIAVFIVVGIKFHNTEYFTLSSSQVKMEISQEAYNEELIDNNSTITLQKEESFNFQYALVSGLLILAIGIVSSRLKKK